MQTKRIVYLSFQVLALFVCTPHFSQAETLTGKITNAESGQPIAARIYLQNEAGKFLHVRSKGGTAVPYAVRRTAASHEVHTSVSAHPFFFGDLPPGSYTLTVEKGKEYLPQTLKVEITDDKGSAEVSIQMRRWIDMAKRGWYSGETHVHRRVAEFADPTNGRRLARGLSTHRLGHRFGPGSGDA